MHFTFALLPLAWCAIATDAAPVISPATRDEQGFLAHVVASPFQAGQTQIRVLLPDNLAPNQKLRAIYVLPVEAKSEQRYGVGLIEVKNHDLANKHRVIFVAPTFSHLPWYADHPTDATIRQETYFLNVVLPIIEKNYPIDPGPAGRLLLGFSKSGWGAWTLLLRHPDIFARAAAWDAPLMMDQSGRYGSGPIFGTQENFENYRLRDLLRSKAELLGGNKRLILTGYGNFRPQHVAVRALLDELKIPHEYRDGPERKHDWHSGWLPEAVELLVSPHASP